MPRTMVTRTEVYRLDELSESAQEKAHQRWVQMDDGNPWQEYVYNDFNSICEILGIELYQRPVHTVGGKTRFEPTIWYSGFWSQGDGACFEGTYRYAKGAVKAIVKFGPQDDELKRIAEELQRVQAQHFYKLTATVKHRGHYYHRFCTDITVEDSRDYCRDIGDAGKDIAEALRDLMLWLYKELESAYEDAVSFEAFKEACESNEYEFTEDGGWV